MEIVGGAISGYCSMGSDTNPIAPRSTKKMDITVESTGRLIKFVNVIILVVKLRMSDADELPSILFREMG